MGIQDDVFDLDNDIDRMVSEGRLGEISKIQFDRVVKLLWEQEEELAEAQRKLGVLAEAADIIQGMLSQRNPALVSGRKGTIPAPGNERKVAFDLLGPRFTPDPREKLCDAIGDKHIGGAPELSCVTRADSITGQ